ncbi:MAG: hypothetical protein JOY62_02105 [Acidobacteriaceae bacterium]|nr:hypothetical protein [Acidobacteriaceae bacterium]
MPHGRTSCRSRGYAVLRLTLEELYAQRSAVEAAIHELELRRTPGISAGDAFDSQQRIELLHPRCTGHLPNHEHVLL